MNSLFFRTAVGGLILGSFAPLHAAPSVAIGESTYLFFDMSAQVESQSNLLRTEEDEVSDTIFVITPGLELKFGGEGSSVAQLKAGYEIRQHIEEGDLNNEFFRLNFASLYDTGVVMAQTYAGYNQYGTNSRFLDVDGNAGVSERLDMAAGFNVKYRFSDQLALGGGADFFRRDWDDDTALVGNESFSVPVKLFFAVDEGLDAFVGYRYRDVKSYDVPDEISGVSIPDYTDNYFFVGLDGQIINPLWSISLDAGFQTREYDYAVMPTNAKEDEDGLTFSGRVNYAAEANRSYYALIARDFGESATRNLSYERTRFSVGGDYRITEMWTASLGLTYATTDYSTDTERADETGYSDRSEDLILAKVGISYVPNEYLTFGASAQMVDNDGDGTGGVTFQNNIITLSASLRY